MRQSNRYNPQLAKKVARQKYKERQIDKFVKWAAEQKGYVKYKEIVELHEQYNIKVYG
jgi:L-fucose isomerase-like protein